MPLLAPLTALALVAGRVDTPAAREQVRLCTTLSREPGVDACRKALDLGLSPARAALVQRVVARRLEGLERWGDAVAAYRDLAALAPQDGDAHLRLGLALLHFEGKADEAEASLRAALARKGDDARAWVGLGSALNVLGRFAESVAAFEEAEKAEPTCFEERPAARLVLEASRRGERWP